MKQNIHIGTVQIPLLDYAVSCNAILGIRDSGKALALDTPIPTPTGWTSMGDVQVGDKLLDERGQECRVTFTTPVQHGRQCFKVCFSDGSEIVADADHLWLTDSYRSRTADRNARIKNAKQRGHGGRPQCERKSFPSVVTTKEISEMLYAGGPAYVEHNHSIPTTKALQLPTQDLLVDPYLLGCWLGDGTSRGGFITTADPEIIQAFRDGGWPVSNKPNSTSGKSTTWSISAGYVGSVEGRKKTLTGTLRRLGVLGNKYIPDIYLRTSRAQRLALLQGLMDTDGTVQRGSNSCVFYSTKIRLAMGARELVSSLGWTSTLRSKRAILNGVDHGECFEVRFRPQETVFRLSRKSDLLNFNVGQNHRRLKRVIIEADEVASVPVRCIQVDSPSHLFLCGETMIPTHNTVTAKGIAEQLLDHDIPIVVFDAVGKWRWMKVPGPGPRGRGYKVVVAGGKAPDLALSPQSVGEIVRSAVKEKIPLIIDLYSPNLSKADWRRIVQQSIRIIHYEASGVAHVFLEEAAEYCLSPDTEMLTFGGWRKIADAEIAQPISCYNRETQQYEFLPISRVLKKQYDGNMVPIKTRSIDCLMTEDHRAVIQRFQHNPARYDIYPPSLCIAADLPMAFTVPHGGAPCGAGVELSDDLLRVMGWVATDGSLHSKGRNYLTISQSDATVKGGVSIVEEMRRVLIPLGASEGRRKPRTSDINRTGKTKTHSPSSEFFLKKTLSNEIARWMGTLIHRIPRMVIESATRRQLEVLFQGLLEGDGTRNVKRWRCFYAGLNEGLADDFQEIATKLGVGTVKVFRSGQWRVSISQRRTRHWIQKFKPIAQAYSGEVVCVTVPTGSFVARRNGTVFVTGNCPQKVTDGETYAEVEKLARMGGNASVGITIINQRSQEVNKAVLDLAHNLILGCQIGNRAIDAIEKWVDRLSPDTAKAVTTSLPHLKSGEAWVWTRSNPDDPKREHLPMCRSLHPDRRTPDVVLKSAKAVDPEAFVKRLQVAIPKIIEEAKAKDPKELTRTIIELRKQVQTLEKKPGAPAPPTVKIETKVVEKKVVIEGTISRLEKLLERAEKAEETLRDISTSITGETATIAGMLLDARKINAPFQEPPSRMATLAEGLVRGGSKSISGVVGGAVPRAAIGSRSIASSSAPRITGVPASAGRDFDGAQTNGDVKITGGALRALKALATRPEQRVTRSQLATLAKMKANSGTFSTYMSTLRTAGFLVDDGKFFQITGSGMDYLGVDIPQAPQTSEELLQQWLGAKSISGKARDILILLWNRRESGEMGLSRQDLAATVGLAESGTYSTYLSTLRSNGLIEERDGRFQATDALFI